LYIFSVIVAGDIVASEFTTGTIKMLAIRPISRSRILLSKYIASLLFALTCLAVYFATAVLVGGILEGFKGFSVPHVGLSFGSDYAISATHKTHYLIYLLQQSGYYFVEIGLFVTLSFLVSTIFKSSSMAIGISSFLLFFNLIFARILAIQFDWMKYYLFINTDLTQFAAGNSPIRPSMTLTSALITIAIYFVGMLAITWTIFNRRDIRV
jgi:ABC-2 type transport system permease protein